MGDISKHFNRSEFACRCGCGYDTVDAELLTTLEDIRIYFDKPITITSGCRCAGHNQDVGGTFLSQHCYGKAVDFKVKNVHEDDIVEYLHKKYPCKYGIGRYNGRTHIDIRHNCARWDNR